MSSVLEISTPISVLVEVEAADDAELLVEVALGVEVSAEAGPNVGEGPQPVGFLGEELVFFVSELDLDLALVLVLEQLLDAVVELQDRRDEDEPVAREPNDLFEIIVGRAGI